MQPGKVLINIPAEYSNLDPRVWANGDRIACVPVTFKVGDGL